MSVILITICLFKHCTTLLRWQKLITNFILSGQPILKKSTNKPSSIYNTPINQISCKDFIATANQIAGTESLTNQLSS